MLLAEPTLVGVVVRLENVLQGQSEAVSDQLNEEEQLLVISRLHQVSYNIVSLEPADRW